MKEKISFALMAGGMGRRFGGDKTKALLLGKPLHIHGLELGLKISSDVMQISRDPAKYVPFLPAVRYLSDSLPFQCPMAGMVTAGENALYDKVFILSADAPLMGPEELLYIVSRSEGRGGAVPVIGGKYYPLAAVYSKEALLSMKNLYDAGIYKITESFKNLDLYFIPEEELVAAGFSPESFINVNTKEDLISAQKAAASRRY